MPKFDLTYEQEKKFLTEHKFTTYSMIVPVFAYHIVTWIEEQGYKVGFQHNEFSCGINQFGRYCIVFPNEEIMSAFLIRWFR